MKQFYFPLIFLSLTQVNISISAGQESFSLAQQLLEATQKNNLSEVIYLLEAGAPIDFQDKIFFNYNTPLAVAADRGYKELVQSLLERGARVNITNKQKNTPLHRAAAKGHTGVVKLLLHYGADPDIQGSDGHTPLYMATDNGHTETIDVLLKHGANPNIPTTDSYQMPLHIAAYKNNTIATQLLLAWDATLTHQNGAQKTPLDLALSKNNTEIIALLTELTDYKTLLAQIKNPTQHLFRHALAHGYYKLALQLLKHDSNHDITITAHDINIVYQQYKQADKNTKNIYRALGRLLILHLRFTSNLQELSKIYTLEQASIILEFMPTIIQILSKKRNTSTTSFYPIAKQGLVGVHGLTKDLAERIAHFTVE